MNKTVVKIQFKNWYEGFNYEDLGPILCDNSYFKESDMKLEITNTNPDIIFYNVFGNFLYQSSIDDDKAIKVLFITEPISSDFLFFDYCIGFEPYDYGGRNCFYPFFLYSSFVDGAFPKKITYSEAKNILKSKSIFCEMVYSHDGRDVSRKRFFNLLSSYKKVESAGTYLNNQPHGKTVDYRDKSNTKFEFQKKAKFSLCIQSIKKEWFINEKIMHAFFANEIPIFYGCDEIKKIFNPERFIFVDDYPNDEALLKRIVEIDNDNELFCKIISSPIFIDNEFPDKTFDNAKKFVYELFKCQKKRLVEKNREKIIKSELIKGVNSINELNKLEANKFFKMLVRIKKCFRKGMKNNEK